MESKRIVLADVNQCIYCQATEGKLSQEHVVPFGLNGEHILLHASCQKCAAITSKIEGTVLRETFIAARKRLNLKSRHRKAWDSPKDAFTTLLFPISEPPAHLTGNAYVHGVNIKGMTIIPLSGSSRKQTVTFHGNDFERMLAKIALGFAVSAYGIIAFEEFYVRSGILGEKEDMGRWVGRAEGLLLPYRGLMYYVHVQEMKKEVICRIKLFAMLNPPEYQVVVGKLKNEYSRNENEKTFRA